MKNVYIVVDGVTYTLSQNSSGEWVVTNKAPYVAGKYPITVIATTEAGSTMEIDVDDPDLIKALTLIVTEGTTASGERMMKYYPEVIRKLLEFQALVKSEGFEIDFLRNDVELTLNEAYLSTMSEGRVESWEKALGIVYASGDSLQDRRDTIIARIRGQGKLNTALINSIVNAFTGGTAQSYIKNGVLYVKVTPPPDNKQYKFTNIVQELKKKMPVHLGLEVTRNYATWKEVSENFANWNSVKELDTWQSLADWTAPQ